MEAAKKESREATEALPAENVAREAYGEACLEANTVLVQGLNIVRAVFGPKSAEYKQFITRDRKEDEEIEEESGIGEE